MFFSEFEISTLIDIDMLPFRSENEKLKMSLYYDTLFIYNSKTNIKTILMYKHTKKLFKYFHKNNYLYITYT